jgi:septum site-determining protein MinD
MRGKLTVLVDMDMGLRNLDVALGLESSVVYDVSDVIEGSCTLEEALVKDTRYENLFFIPAPQTKDASSLSVEDTSEFWERLSQRFDYCLIDAPAGIDGGFKYGMQGADAAIVVTIPETAALRDADRVISVLEDNGIEDIRLVINKVRPDMIEKGIMMNVDDCVDMLGVPILGIVGDDEQVIVSSLKGQIASVEGNSKAGQAFYNIALRIMGEDVPIMDFDEEHGFFAALKRLFGKH